MYNNSAIGFIASGFDIGTIPNYNTVWNMYTWKLSSSSPYYQFRFNLGPWYSITDSNASLKNGFYALGGLQGPGQYWGDIAKFHLYNSFVSDTAIFNIYNSNFPYASITMQSFFTTSGGLYQWYDANGVSGTSWTDKSGNGLTGSISGTVNISTDTAGSNGNTVGISYYTGNTSSSVSFGGSIPGTYTVCVVSRYTGGSNGRIINASVSNTLIGHWSGYAGVVYEQGWMYPNGTSQISQNGAGVASSTSWVFMCVTSSGSRLISNNSGILNPGNGNGASGTFGINNGTTETSNWALAEFIMWNRELNVYEMSMVNAYVYNKYGIGAAPSNTLGTGVLLFSHRVSGNNVTSEGFQSSSEASNTGLLSSVSSTAVHKYSIINQIGSFLKSNGTYEFYMYIFTDGAGGSGATSAYNHWTQTSNPYTTGGDAQGYVSIYRGWNSENQSGLRQSGSPNNTYMDVESASGNWWGAVGVYNAVWGGGFPEDGGTRTWIQLWMVA